MKLEAGLLDETRTKGFVKVEDFHGKTTTINMKQLVELRLFLERLKKMGIQRVTIGLDDNSPLFLFLDDKKEMAFALAPEIIAED
jgi:hypothetical protein